MSDPAKPAPLPRRLAIDVATALGSSVLLWLSFPPAGQFYLAWVALVPLLCRIHFTKRTPSAACYGYATGLLFFLFGFHWLCFATTGGYIVVCLILSLYWALFAALTHRYRRFGPVAYSFAFAIAFASTEYLRGVVLGGFPWLNLGHTQSPFLLICQIADVTGVAGITAWVAMINACVARLLIGIYEKRLAAPSRDTPGASRRESLSSHPNPIPAHQARGPETVLAQIIVPIVITLCLLGYGLWRNSQITVEASTVSIALVQSNHIHTPDGEKTVTQQEQIDYLLQKSRTINNVDLIAWPETTMPPLNVEARTEPGLGGAAFFNQTLEQIGTLAQDRNAAIVTGGYFVGGFKGEMGKRKATDIRNSVYVISRNRELVGRYDKVRLVPFAEWLPFQDSESVLHRLMSRFATASYAGGYHLTPSTELKVFKMPGVRVVTPICFEDTIAPLVRRFFAPDERVSLKRADLILNISNDGWFNAAEKQLHLQIAVFRSIENRVPAARVSNTGQSASIDSNGRIVETLPAFSEGILISTCRLDPRVSFYTCYGEAFAWLCLIGSVVFLGLSFRPNAA